MMKQAWHSLVALYISWISLLLYSVGAFTSVGNALRRPAREEFTKHLSLVPLTEFSADLQFFSRPSPYRCCIDEKGKLDIGTDGDDYVLGVIEKKDLPDVASFVIQSFGSDTIALSSDLNAMEQALVGPPIIALNTYMDAIAYAEVYSGLEARTRTMIDTPRVSPPTLQGTTAQQRLSEAQSNSLVLAIARAKPESDWRCDVIASVELRLQPSDAKIPFTLPWLDMVERRLSALVGIKGDLELQPYLSNLCVREDCRGRGIGKALCRCVEDIASSAWGYDRMYLHVDPDNEAAMKLYQGENYKDVGRRFKPFWAGKATTISYFAKRL